MVSEIVNGPHLRDKKCGRQKSRPCPVLLGVKKSAFCWVFIRRQDMKGDPCSGPGGHPQHPIRLTHISGEAGYLK